MTNPFTTTVGLKGVSPDSPAPVILINDISGITAELVTALKTTDTAAAAEVWGKVQRLGLEKLTSLVQEQLSKSADFQYEMNRTGFATGDARQPLMPGAYWNGVRLQVPYGKYQAVTLETLALQSAASAPVATTLVVIDLRTGATLLTKMVTVAPDYDLIDIGLTVSTVFGRDADLFIGVDCTNLPLLSLGDTLGWESNDAGFSVEPVTKLTGTTTADSASYAGVVVAASVRNDLSAVVARYADRLQWAYAYVCGSLLMREKLASPNFNLYTNTNRLFTEDQEVKLMEEARSRIKPVALDMLKELSNAKAATPKRDRPFEPGFQSQSFVDESVFWNPVTGYGGYSQNGY